MLLQPMLHRLRDASGLREQLRTALNDVVALHGAERGNLQLMDAERHLVIVEQRGLPEAFLKALGRLSLDCGSVCARAVGALETVCVPDIETDEEFAHLRAIARTVPFRSVISAPILAPGQEVVGAVSVHFANRFEPTRLELDSLAAYCGMLGALITQADSPAELRRQAPLLAHGAASP